jgi:uncharacterized protein (DUF1810 family)
MTQIGIEKYNLFIKYGALIEGLAADDRGVFPKEATGISIDETYVLSELEEHLSYLATGMYGRKLQDKSKQKIEELKIKVTEEVFQLLSERSIAKSGSSAK